MSNCFLPNSSTSETSVQAILKLEVDVDFSNVATGVEFIPELDSGSSGVEGHRDNK